MAFALDSLWRGTSQELSNAKCSNLSQRGAKPAQARNEINGRGPPPAGRMPFMSDSTLSRRSAALRTKLPTGNGEMPENFKYVWLVFCLRFNVVFTCSGQLEA